MASVTACSLVLSPPFVRPIRRPRPPFYPEARGRAVGFQISCIDHDGLLLSALSGQTLHHPGEDPPVAPSLPTIVERLRRPILPGRITPPQAFAIDEDYPAQHAPVIDPWLAVGPGKERPKPVHLHVGQPEKITHHCPHQFGSVNHAAKATARRLMGPEPRNHHSRYIGQGTNPL